MSPPGAVAPVPTSGERRAPSPDRQTERLARIAQTVVDNCGLEFSRSRISRIVRTFEARVAGNGWSFFDFLATSIQLDAERRRQLLNDPAVARAIAYADPTGETAVRNVMRGAAR